MISTYIFDLDDTIIDSSIYSRMYNELLTRIEEEAHIPSHEVKKQIEVLRQETGKHRPDTFELCRRLDCVDLYYTVLEKYIAHTYSLKSGSIPRIFKEIKERLQGLGVVSNSQERTVRMVLERFRLLNYVDFVESGKKETIYFWVQLSKKRLLDKKTTLVIDDSEEVRKLAEQAGYKVLDPAKLSDIGEF